MWRALVFLSCLALFVSSAVSQESDGGPVKLTKLIRGISPLAPAPGLVLDSAAAVQDPEINLDNLGEAEGCHIETEIPEIPFGQLPKTANPYNPSSDILQNLRDFHYRNLNVDE